MRRRVIFDGGEPVVIRHYPWGGLATVDRDLLAANGIPSIIRQETNGEVIQRAQLLVRREHSAEALEILDAASQGADAGEDADGGP